MLDHNDVRHKLSEYIDGSITDQEKTAIEEHLKTCSACGDALTELRKTIEHVKTIEDVEPPAWMTQKIMTKVRSGAEEKKSLFQRFFFPLSVKLPIQAVAVLFLTVTAFYIYRNIQPAPTPSETPVQESSVRNEPPPAPAPRYKHEEPKITKDASVPAKKVPQAPEYKALDMKLEYEKPAPPAAVGKTAESAPSPEKAEEQPVQNKTETPSERLAAPSAGAPMMLREQAASSEPELKRKSVLSPGRAAGLSGKTEELGAIEAIILEKYPTGKPKLIVTYRIIASRKVKLAEEAFNNNGERHGIQKEYYESGQIKTEARYEQGKLAWYMEFLPDGVKKTGKSDYDWYWLKK